MRKLWITVFLVVFFFVVEAGAAPLAGTIIPRDVFNQQDFSSYDLNVLWEGTALKLNETPSNISIYLSFLNVKELDSGDYLVVRQWNKYKIKIFGETDVLEGETPTLYQCVKGRGGWSIVNVLWCWKTVFKPAVKEWVGEITRSIRARLTRLQDEAAPFDFDEGDWSLGRDDLN